MDDICPVTKKPCVHVKPIHVTDIKDGVVTEVHMCPQCAEQYLNPPEKKPEPPSVGGLLGLLALMFLGSKAARRRAEQPKVPVSQCPGCGTTPQDVARTGRFGCPMCYEYYNASIHNVLNRCQDGGTKHVGKVPPNSVATQEAMLNVKEQIRTLEEKMAKAIKLENYEVAGVLKSKIQELRKKLPSDSI